MCKIRLRGEALECVIRQDGLRIKYLVPYIHAPYGHVAGVGSRQAKAHVLVGDKVEVLLGSRRRESGA